MAWFGRDRTLKSIQFHSLPWAGLPFNRLPRALSNLALNASMDGLPETSLLQCPTTL